MNGEQIDKLCFHLQQMQDNATLTALGCKNKKDKQAYSARANAFQTSINIVRNHQAGKVS